MITSTAQRGQTESSGGIGWLYRGQAVAVMPTNETIQKCPAEQVLGHYKELLDVEEAKTMRLKPDEIEETSILLGF